MEKQLWTQPFLVIQDERREDELGTFRVKILDFAKASDRTTVPQPKEVKRFGWLLITGGANDPVVGSEDDPMLAWSRALGVRGALYRELLPLAQTLTPAECAGCGDDTSELESCPGCGRPTCDRCFGAMGGCGCGVGADRAPALTPELLRAGSAAEVQPESRVVPIAEEMAAEARRLAEFER